MIISIKQILARWFKFGFVSNISRDNASHPITQVTGYNKTQSSILMLPYGFTCNPPLKNLCVLLNIGNEENTVTMPISGDDRLKKLKEGECALFNGKTGTYIHLSEDGSVEILSKKNININVSGDVNLSVTGNVNLTAPTTNINGDLNVTGAITGNSANITNGVTANTVIGSTDVTGGGISLSGHVHPAGQPPGNTGPPL